jgi:arylsulfatase A-like enzyme
MRVLIALFVLLTLSGCGVSDGLSAIPVTPPPARPNIILIVADDLGQADLASYGTGPSAVKTPNLDRLIGRGVRFDRGYSTASVCSPSRAGLLTGQYQQRHGFEFLTPSGADAGGQGLAPEQRVIAADLAAAGYRTGMVGKWHLGASPDRLPTARGFDRFYGFLPGETAYLKAGAPGSQTLPAPYVGTRSFERRVDWTKVVRDRSGDKAGPVIDPDEASYLTDTFTREAVDFIDGAGSEPYFLYLAHLAPHAPFQALDRDLKEFADISDPTRRVYSAMIRALDRSVGEVLDAVDRSGRAQDTLIIFTADNGAATYMGVSDCDRLAGGKLSYFEGGARVPMVISWPRRWPAGRTDRRNVSQLDVAPTILSAAGVSSPTQFDGVDLTPLIQPGRAGETVHETLFWRTGPEFAILAGDMKLMSNTRPGAFAWLFDLSTDPHEERSLTYSRPEVVEELQRRYRAWESEMKPPRWPAGAVLQVFQCGRIAFHEQ